MTEAQVEKREIAFTAAITEHGPAMMACALRVLGSWHIAEEATQEASINVWRKLDNIESADPKKLRSWLCVIAFNKALDINKTEKRRGLRLVASEGLAAGEIDATALNQTSDRIDNPANFLEFMASLSELEPSVQKILVAQMAGLPNQQIGELTGLSTWEVRQGVRQIKDMPSKIPGQAAA